MYERFFGLVDTPFRLTPDARYLYLSATHADALAHLRLGLAETSGFVCITGDVGAGKTTLLRTFIAELGILANTRSRKKLVDALNAHLLTQRSAGRSCMVVIDEAQALGIEVLEQLRLLSNLETATEKLLRIVLVGQPQLYPAYRLSH